MKYGAVECTDCRFDDDFGLDVIIVTSKQLKNALEKFRFDLFATSPMVEYRVKQHPQFLNERLRGARRKQSKDSGRAWYANSQ